VLLPPTTRALCELLSIGRYLCEGVLSRIFYTYRSTLTARLRMSSTVPRPVLAHVNESSVSNNDTSGFGKTLGRG